MSWQMLAGLSKFLGLRVCLYRGGVYLRPQEATDAQMEAIWREAAARQAAKEADRQMAAAAGRRSTALEELRQAELKHEAAASSLLALTEEVSLSTS
jgi:hypothetical protein